jgi:hypothetical protein
VYKLYIPFWPVFLFKKLSLYYRVDILIKVSFVYIGKKIIKIIVIDVEQGIYIKYSDYCGIRA